MTKALLTRAGYERLLQELRQLSQVVRPQTLSEVMEAAQDGRLEKNTEYLEARSRQVQVERRIQHLQQTLANSEVLVGSNLAPTRAVFNSQVRIRNLLTGQILSFQLVGEEESDAQQGRLSIASPVGRALLGRAVGDQIRIQTPGGLRVYQILEIQMGNT
ncbi:MAG: transcription elongation factor GreA [Deltaproteobacteria bacterium]|nr:transcription elongation factor GreA [Deltaproteobacteria bacterium]MBW1953187.1 transcription elongation factor GreA [Deltaproteobacteria bacterium]MBW1985989.1 transcription elongation factor GreA [Deltaproteobacteria bacterium]MBW2134849.1 transcription elongation factor GreA [Deltaproteobacteria bacterium]